MTPLTRRGIEGSKLVDQWKPSILNGFESVHVTWLDNFGKVLKFQMGDMKQTNFSNFQWTAKGIQRQSQKFQYHIDEKRASKLLSPTEFQIDPTKTHVMPPDLLDDDIVTGFWSEWLGAQDEVESIWDRKTFLARDVTRVPLKLPSTVDDAQYISLLNVGDDECPICFRPYGHPECDIDHLCFFPQVDEDIYLDEMPIHATDDTSASPDGLLNFFPADLLPHAIGTRVGLAKLMTQFNLDFGDTGRVKILNSDIDIYARIIKVTANSES